MRYYKNGIVYSTGNIYALASNPPNYVTDRTYGSFKVDLINKTITKLNIPNSNGYAACVSIFDDKISKMSYHIENQLASSSPPLSKVYDFSSFNITINQLYHN